MSMPLKTICTHAIEALQDSKYQESTINEYRKTFSHLETFALSHGTDVYTHELGEMFRSDTISKRTGKYSLYRWKRRNRCVEMFNWYESYGYFNLAPYLIERVESPDTTGFRKMHSEYLAYLESDGLKENTIDSFRNVTCKYLQFIEKSGIISLAAVPSDTVPKFMIELRKTWSEGSLGTAVSALRSFFRFTRNNTLIRAAERIRTVRSRSIIPVLSDEEENLLWDTLNSEGLVSKRDKSIILLSIMTGIRSCDIVCLKTSDIDWAVGSISFIQQKTGNLLTLPLFPVVGNAIANYILTERPQTICGVLFLRQLAPYKPLSGHSACYRIIKSVFSTAGIHQDKRICGTRLLRHNAASRMLKSRIPIETIAAVLGHSDPNSTEIYLSTDDVMMRECGLPLSKVAISKGVL